MNVGMCFVQRYVKVCPAQGPGAPVGVWCVCGNVCGNPGEVGGGRCGGGQVGRGVVPCAVGNANGKCGVVVWGSVCVWCVCVCVCVSQHSLGTCPKSCLGGGGGGWEAYYVSTVANVTQNLVKVR